MRKVKAFAGKLALGILALSASGAAIAQSTAQNEAAAEGAASDEILVIAERRAVNVQRAPLSVSVRSGEDLRDDTYVRNLQEYTANTNFPTSLPENNVTKILTGDEATRRFNNFTYRARVETDLTPG